MESTGNGQNRVFQRGLFLILCRKDGVGDRPLDAHFRIVPGQAAFILRKIIIGAFVHEIGGIAGHTIAEGKPGGHEQLVLVF